MKDTKRYGVLLSMLAAFLFAIGAPALFAEEGGKPGGDKGMPSCDQDPGKGTDRAKGEEPPGLEKLAAVHGGHVQVTKEFLIETVFQADGLRLFLYDAQAKPMSMKGITAHARIEFTDEAKEALEIDFTLQQAIPKKEGKEPGPEKENPANPPKEGKGVAHGNAAPQDSLWAAIDFSKLKEGEAQAKIAVTALPGKEEKEAQLMVPFKLAVIEQPKEKGPETPEKPLDKP